MVEALPRRDERREYQKAACGILLTLEKPSKPMRDEAVDAGRYQSKLWHEKDYPKIQLLTVEGLLNGTERVDAPPQTNPFAKAPFDFAQGQAAREAGKAEQKELL